MISEKEIRIGNVIRNKTGHIDIVLGILAYDEVPVIETRDGTNNPFDCNGIPLSEKVLLACGFDNTVDDAPEEAELLTFFSEGISVELKPDPLGIKYSYSIALYEDVVDNGGELASQAAYEIDRDDLALHELQNIYYSIFGTELTIDINKLEV